MVFIERDQDGKIIALRRGEKGVAGEESASLNDEEVRAFLCSCGDLEAFTKQLAETDTDIIRVLEDLIDLLASKQVILFTDLPAEAQEKIQRRKKLRTQLADNPLIVDDIL